MVRAALVIILCGASVFLCMLVNFYSVMLTCWAVVVTQCCVCFSSIIGMCQNLLRYVMCCLVV